jgi:Family of unknown function (DUF5906)/RepB DNA-primase N-terminal domain
MTNANFKDDPVPRFDRELVHAHIRLLHDLAARVKADLGIDGQLVLACYGENPDTGVKTGNQVMKFGIGHGVEQMVDAIMALEHHPHLNVYVPFHVVRFGLGPRERGGLRDIVAVLALVVDQDADKDKAGELPLLPHYVIESSPGNKQPVYVLAKAMLPEEAHGYAKALQRFTGTDSGTGDVAHVWRVPGTLNWPNRQKVHERKRPRTPQPVRVLEPWLGEVIDAEVLRAKLGERFRQDEGPGDDPGVNNDWTTSADREALLALLKGSIGAPEIIGWFDVACIDKDNGDRSNHSCRVIMKLFELGFSEGDVLVLMLGTECAKRYTSEKHLRDDIARLKQKKANEELPDYVKRLNQQHAVVLMEGQVLIVREEHDVPHFISPAHFHLWHANDTVEIRTSHNTKHTPVSALWVSHPARRQYSRVVFDPRDTNPLHYNLWRGFAVTADASKSCDKFLAHIRDNICSGNEEHFNWVMAFLAHIVQRPWEKPGVSLVLRGCEGVGKGFFARVIGELCPQHYVVISQAAQLTGKFNAHFQRALVVFVDEGFWAGDKAGEGALKHLVTDEELLIEGKHRDAFMVRNLSRLIIASNEKWVVPAGIRARRWCVLDVADTHANDRAYFRAIDDELHRDGGLAGLMHVLQTFDLGSVDVYAPPKTAALLEQKEESFPPHVLWWAETLNRGTVRYPSTAPYVGDQMETSNWPESILKSLVWEDYALWMRQHNIRSRVLTADSLHRWFKDAQLLPGTTTTRSRAESRARRMSLPPLRACRQAFDAYVAQARVWEPEDEPERTHLTHLNWPCWDHLPD